MRRRSSSELLRDTHIAAIVVAQLIAAAIAALIRIVEMPASWAISSVFNFIAFRTVHDTPLTIYSPNWWFAAVSLLMALVNLATAYLLTVWVYGPHRFSRT